MTAAPMDEKEERGVCLGLTREATERVARKSNAGQAERQEKVRQRHGAPVAQDGVSEQVERDAEAVCVLALLVAEALNVAHHSSKDYPGATAGRRWGR